MDTVTKYLGRTKLQVAILAVLLVIANKYAGLGLDNAQLTTAVMGLIAYIVGQSFVDAAATRQTPPGKQ